MNLILILKNLAITKAQRVIILWRRVTLYVETGVRVYFGVIYNWLFKLKVVFIVIRVFGLL